MSRSKEYYRQNSKKNHRLDKKIRELYNDPHVDRITFSEFKKKHKKAKLFNLGMLLLFAFQIGFLLPF